MWAPVDDMFGCLIGVVTEGASCGCVGEFVELVAKPESSCMEGGKECSGLSCLFAEVSCGNGDVYDGGTLQIFPRGCGCCESGSCTNLFNGLFVELVG